jgi:hypothetical protein
MISMVERSKSPNCGWNGGGIMTLRFKWPDAVDINFPNLKNTEHEITSCPTSIYNCIAWAAGDSSRRWWPRFCDQLFDERYYWPDDAPEEETVAAFIRCFEILGYEVCGSCDLEQDFEKVVIYTKNGNPKHAARQLPNGEWSSKLGLHDTDISHEISALDGPCYGSVEVVMRRRRT